MAFGRGSATGVARADVEFRAETGKFEADVTQAKRIYTSAIDGMSDASLRMSVQQEKLDRAISRFGPNSLQARQAGVNYRRELNNIQREQDQTRRSADRMATSITRGVRGSIAASGAFKGLGNALFFASGAFAGAFGFIYALRTALAKASEAQVVMGQLETAVRNAGLSWTDHADRINKAIEAQSKLTAFDDEDLKRTLAALVIRTKDVNDALDLNRLAASVARARNVELGQAMTLVTRASLGQTASLRRLGIDVQKVTTEQDKLREAGVQVTFQQRKAAKEADRLATQRSVIAQLEAKFAGQAEKYAKSAAGRQEYFNKVLGDTQEIIGLALLPTFSDLLERGAKWLDAQNKSGNLQKEINRDLKIAGTVLKGVASAFGLVKSALEPIIDLMGGLHNAVQFLLLGTLAFKILKVVGALKTMSATFGLVATAAETSSARTVIAENAIGNAAVVNAGKVGILRTALAGLGIELAALGGLSLGAVAAGAGVVVAGVAAGVTTVKGLSELEKALGITPNEKEQAQRIVKAMRNQGPAWAKQAWSNMGEKLRQAVEIELRRQKEWGLLKALGLYVPPTSAQANAATDMTGFTQPPAGPPPPGSQKAPPPPRTEVDIQLDISRAQVANNEAAEIRYLRELRAYYQRQADRLNKRKNLTLLQKQKLLQLNDQIESTDQAIESIISGQESEAKARAAARAKAARDRHTRIKNELAAREQFLENQLLRAAATPGGLDDKKWAAALINFYKKAAHNMELTAKERQAYENKRLKVMAKLRTARSEALEKRLDIKERKLRNAVEAAELKEGLKDDEKALKNLIAFYRAEEKNRDLSEKARLEAQRKRIAAQKKLKNLKDDDAKKGSFSGAEFLSSLQGTLNTYGGNLFAPGDLRVGGRVGESHSVIQTGLLRKQNKILEDLSGRVRLPASRAGYTNMTSLYDGMAT